MNTFTEIRTETFHIVSCYFCGVRFGIDERLHRSVVTDASRSVYCPACGGRTEWTKSEAQKRIEELEKKLAWEASQSARRKEEIDRQIALRKETENSLSATRGVVARLKTRAKNGVCPCCHRTVSQLAKHMESKHPNFNPAKTE